LQGAPSPMAPAACNARFGPSSLIGWLMAGFDYGAPADLFPARSRHGRRPIGYRRFATAAEAIRFVIEQMPVEFLDGTILEVENDRVDGARIVTLYDSADYPLVRKAK